MNLEQYNQENYQIGRAKIIVLIWWLIQSTLFRLSIHNMYRYRRMMLILFGAKIGKNVKIRSSARFHYPWKVEIDDNSWVGDDTYFYSLDNIYIGKNSVISQKTYLCTGSHDIRKQSFDLITKPIVIKDNVWIAADCFIHPGTIIENNVIVSARSNVVDSLKSDYIYAGNPAEVIKSIPEKRR
ncbi:WcaF family extracellular polysaccharide biosynthesis acetyltransferase [Exiguobacterium acetylicum]|uniref:WcaF family extracellular polysaccharide biosynthesis acetyltransferase n=1 Tax=Exiguobacterium acetylicum TaxID=41170 RepID=UPI0030172B94